MGDAAKELEAKFRPQHRYANFGPVVSGLRVEGFRGITSLELEPQYPVLALSGFNGSGKSTVGQLMACAYKRPSTARDYRRFYVKDFFPLSILDPAPFTSDARTVFQYETSAPGTRQDVTVSRAKQEWSGYKRQPERYCHYVGFTLYIPKVERRDLSIYNAERLELRQTRDMTVEGRRWVAGILNQPYEAMLFQSVGHGRREAELAMASRFGGFYSENHMGFGEGRVLYMVSLMESAPEQSLFVLEEPETSLHEEAQFRFARYVIDVCNRRHHQVVLSTHSSAILEALPRQARVLLSRDKDGVFAREGESSTRARAILSGGHKRALTVAVEDEFAQVLLENLVRSVDVSMLKTLKIVPYGSKQDVAAAVRVLKKAGHKAIAVRDGDTGANPQDGLYCLPGSRPPELEVFGSPAVASAMREQFGVDIPAFLLANPVADHHHLPDAIADAAETGSQNLVACATRAYVEALDEGDRQQLVGIIGANT